MAKDKIILVASAVGRVGSSAAMGVLKAAGLYTGREESQKSPAPMNPKGFHELKAQFEFLERAYRGYYAWGPTQPPPLGVLDEIGRGHGEAYHAFLLQEFEGHFPIALKANRCLIYPLLDTFRDSYDIRAIRLQRSLDDQVRSIMRVWQTSDREELRNATQESILEHIRLWNAFADAVHERYAFPTIRVRFESLIADSVGTAGTIAAFAGIPAPPEAAVREWIDPSLVNRARLSAAATG